MALLNWYMATPGPPSRLEQTRLYPETPCASDPSTTLEHVSDHKRTEIKAESRSFYVWTPFGVAVAAWRRGRGRRIDSAPGVQSQVCHSTSRASVPRSACPWA